MYEVCVYKGTNVLVVAMYTQMKATYTYSTVFEMSGLSSFRIYLCWTHAGYIHELCTN